MKTTKRIFVTLIALFAVSAGFASGGLKVNVSDSESTADLTVVEISAAKMSTFEINISDVYGQSIYSMKTEAPEISLKKKYDFSLLEDGDYWYSVKIDNEKIVKKFKVEDGKYEVLDVKKSIEPYFNLDEKTLKINFLNPQMESVKLYVYDEYNDLLAEKDLGTDMAIHEAVSFSDLDFGKYQVVIADNLDAYGYEVSLD